MNQPDFCGSVIAGTPPRTLRVAGALPRYGSEAQITGAERTNLIADRRRLLEIEVGGGRLHLLIEIHDVRFELLVRTEGRAQIARVAHRRIIPVVHAG